MGTIWVATDSQLRRQVALKLMSPDHLASPTARTRFEREALAVAQLKSPNVVQIYDYGVDGGAPFIVMELLLGEDLQTRVNRVGRISVMALASMFSQVAKGVGAAHVSGIVHRDLKPANIFLARHDTDEVVKVLDFGVASLVAGAGSGNLIVTRAGSVIGTPQYMSPEQVRGSSAVDYRSDLWALGVVCYRALTGNLPFEATSFSDMLLQICTDPVVPPSRVRPELGAEIDAFFEQALARDPARRFESARDMAAALSSIATATRERSAKILVVDDEPDVALLMRQRFRQHIRRRQYELTFATSGAKAIDVLYQQSDTEVVLADINMPEMDGLTLLRKATEINPEVKVIVVTAYSDMSYIREAMNRGAFDFLVKPIDFKDLEVTIDNAIKRVRELRRTSRSNEENQLLRMLVSPSALERLLPAIRQAEASPIQRIEVTVAVVTVSGLASGVALTSPEEGVRALNANLEIIVPEMHAQNGVVDKFVSHAVIVVFRGDRHLERAVSACLNARRKLARLSETGGESSPYALGVATGIDSGTVVEGGIGARVASRVDYAVLGTAVSGALQLSALARNNEILLSREAFACVASGI